MQPLPRVMGNMCGREDAISELRCIGIEAGGCGRQIRVEEIMGWDKDTITEYRQSGWCPACQYIIFRDPEEEFPCTCQFVDVGVGLIPYPMNDYCEQHGERIDQDSIGNDYYDPDMREDEPPHDITEILWPVGVL